MPLGSLVRFASLSLALCHAVIGFTENASDVYANASVMLRLGAPFPIDAADANQSLVQTYTALEELQRLLPNQTALMSSLLFVIDGSDDHSKVSALLLIQELVEDLDKAADFRNVLDGYRSIAALLANESAPARLHELAGWVAGTAAQNQRELQLHLLELGVLPPLLRLVRSEAAPLATRAKALFALSALVRNNPEGQHAFETHAGLDALLAAIESAVPRLVRKALVLLADLIHESLAAAAAAAAGRETYDGHPHAARPSQPLWRGAQERGELLCRAVLNCLRLGDVDSQEKAVTALKYLHAAGLIEPAPEARGSNVVGVAEAQADGGRAPAHDCRRRGVPSELKRLLGECGDASRPALQRRGGAVAEALNCEELLPMLLELNTRLSGKGGPAVRTIETDTVFHIEV